MQVEQPDAASDIRRALSVEEIERVLHVMNLTLFPNTLAVSRLDPDAPIPDWATGAFISITRTMDELSVVCDQEQVPRDVQAERGWRCLRVAGKLDFSMVGVISTLTTVLAESGVSVFVVSTFDTDFVLVRETDVAKAVDALRQAGHKVSQSN